MLAIDVGATWVRIGRDASRPELVVATPRTRAELLDQLVAAVMTFGDVSSVGVACPGLVDDDGCIRSSFFAPLSGLPLRAELARRLSRRILVVLLPNRGLVDMCLAERR